MMIIALLAVAAAQPGTARAGAVLHPTATVRIIAGERLTLGAKIPQAELRRTNVRDTDGQVKPARLIEFQ